MPNAEVEWLFRLQQMHGRTSGSVWVRADMQAQAWHPTNLSVQKIGEGRAKTLDGDFVIQLREGPVTFYRGRPGVPSCPGTPAAASPSCLQSSIPTILSTLLQDQGSPNTFKFPSPAPCESQPQALHHLNATSAVHRLSLHTEEGQSLVLSGEFAEQREAAITLY